MSQSVIIAGVGNAQVYSPTGDHILTSKTLVNSGMSFTTTIEEIRGGGVNQLLGTWAHDSGLSLTLEDALFNLNHLALNIGSTIQISGDVVTTEQITVTESNKITVSENPQDFIGFGTVGYYKKTSESDDSWEKVEFVGKEATVNAEIGDVLCVRYAKADMSAEKLVVGAAFMPSQASVILTLPMFRAGTDTTKAYTSASKIGEIQVKVPKFMFDGASELSLTSSGAATSSLSGKALASYTGASCEEDGTYAEIVSVTYNKDEFADVKTIVIADSDVEIAEGEDQTLVVYAIYGGTVAPRVIDNSKLTFTSSADENATVGAHTGVVHGVQAGDAHIEVIVTSKPTLKNAAVVTVSSI